MRIVFKEHALEDAYNAREIMSLTAAVSSEAWESQHFPGVIPMLVETDHSQAFGFVPDVLLARNDFNEEDLRAFVGEIIGDMEKETSSGEYSFHDHTVVITRNLDMIFTVDEIVRKVHELKKRPYAEFWTGLTSCMPCNPKMALEFWTDGDMVLFKNHEDAARTVCCICDLVKGSAPKVGCLKKKDDGRDMRTGWYYLKL